MVHTYSIMDDLSYTWLIAFQLGFLLLAANIFQYFFTRWHVKRALKLKDQLKQVREAKIPVAPLSGCYLDIEFALAQTKDRHLSIDPSGDLSLQPSNPSAVTSALALRYALLTVEKNAQSNDIQNHWSVLEEQLKRIATELADNSSKDEELDSLRATLNNTKDALEKVERLKKLVAGLQKKWGALEENEGIILPQLIQLIEGVENQDEIAGLLKQLHAGFEQVGDIFSEESAESTPPITTIKLFDETDNTTKDQENSDPQTQESFGVKNQITMLSNVSKEQGELITKLKSEIVELKSVDALERKTNEVDRLKREAKQFDASIKLLESDLRESSNIISKNKKELSTLSLNYAESNERVANLENEIIQLKNESNQLLQKPNSLIDENFSLSVPDASSSSAKTEKQTLSNAPNNNPAISDNVIALEQSILKKQYEIYRLEEKHVSIETRYLQLYQQYKEK